MTFKNLAMCSAILAATALVACGGGEPSGETDRPTPSTSAPSAAEPATSTPASIALPTTPLNRDALLGVISETIVEPGPCPFLSEATALATAETNYELIRREVSNETCRWSKNAGFSLRVSIEPLATATPFKDRPYNLDTPPVLKQQASPGSNAVILYDTAWDKERPYAMGFEQGDKLVEVFVTGMETDTARLTATAEEIAAKLPTAPMIEAQRREIKPALDYCDIWSNESLGSLMKASRDEPQRNAQYGSAGCKWDAGYGSAARSISLARYKKGDTNLDKMQELGGRTITALGERAVILTRPPTEGYTGDTSLWVEIDDQQIYLTLSGTIDDHSGAATTLMENLLSRF